MDGVQLLLVVMAAVGATAIANRRGLQPPLVLVVIGFAVSFIPGLPRLELDPDVILGIVVPPLVFSTAQNFSIPNLIRNLYPILGLGVGLVIATAFVIGLVANRVVPELTFPAALVLGAVVAPPDAASAVAIGGKLGVPKRVMLILTGEGLLNDAAALTVFSVGVAAVAGTHTIVANPALFFLYSAGVGVVVGIALALAVHWVRLRLDDPGLETVLSLTVPFAAYLLAEELHASGVLAVVMAGFVLGQNAASAGYATRLQERQVWASLDVLLEAFVFAYMGLQLRFVIDDARGAGQSPLRLLLICALILVVATVLRTAWVYAGPWLGLLLSRLTPRGRRALDERRQGGLPAGGATQQPGRVIVAWAGMRGVVTLAAATGIPLTTASGAAFPGRPAIQFIAFVLAVGTLLIQGATLPALVRKLDLSTAQDEQDEKRELRHAQQVSRAASRDAVREVLANPPDNVDPKLLQAVADRLRQAEQARSSYTDEVDPIERDARRHDLNTAISRLRNRMLQAQRQALVKERDEGHLDDDVLREVLEQLDYEEAATSTQLSQLSQRLS